MKSDLPKVLCSVLGRPMIEFVLDALQAGGVEQVIAVVGYRASDVRQQLVARKNVRYVEQTERLGTGHAVKMAREQIAAHRGPVLVVAGDSPMIQAESVRRLLAAFGSAGASPSQFGSAGASPSQKTACLLGTLHKDNPYGLGRIVRDASGEFAGIVEERMRPRSSGRSPR
jgi:bifunctional UDP-N-acetylglucosamine pyrophosphorylase/glucosamine-1-phosphate N-acetyltransferase/UDP-N-acetylglucosamine pyrophosphorylase